MKNVSIIIITYKSEKIIYDFIKKIPSTIKTIIIENSQNHKLKMDIEKEYKNISLYIRENNGVSSALNFAVDKIDTEYFLQISPDVHFNFENLEIFLNYAKILGNNFAALGPRFLNVDGKSHKQIDKNLESAEIDSNHGSCMFINKRNFEIIGKFDENFFLYFEETDYCLRGKRKGFKSYQINKIKIETIGRSVNIFNKDQKNLENLLIWHFIWSKFYFSKKKYGTFLTYIIFIPLTIRTIFKTIWYKLLFDKNNHDKYRFRLKGLCQSMLNKKSNLRLQD